MADNRSLPFKERAYEHYESERARLQRVTKQMEQKEIEAIDEYREPVSLDERKEITILLSWGGPSDGYKVYFDKDGEVMEGYYFFADWFEYEEYKLTDSELDAVLRVYPVGAI